MQSCIDDSVVISFGLGFCVFKYCFVLSKTENILRCVIYGQNSVFLKKLSIHKRLCGEMGLEQSGWLFRKGAAYMTGGFED